MTNIETNFTIELTIKLQTKEIECLEGALDFGKGRSLISRAFVTLIYTRFNTINK